MAYYTKLEPKDLIEGEIYKGSWHHVDLPLKQYDVEIIFKVTNITILLTILRVTVTPLMDTRGLKYINRPFALSNHHVSDIHRLLVTIEKFVE